MSDEEFLDVGADRRPGLTWRVRVVLLASVLAVGAAGLVVDRVLRDREERAVAACAAEVASAVDVAGRRVRAVYEYVRPSLVNPPPELQAGVRRMLATAAAGSGESLSPARQACVGISVFPLHDALQARRDRCLAVLEEQRAGLEAVGVAGSGLDGLDGLGDWLDAPRTC